MSTGRPRCGSGRIRDDIEARINHVADRVYPDIRAGFRLDASARLVAMGRHFVAACLASAVDPASRRVMIPLLHGLLLLAPQTQTQTVPPVDPAAAARPTVPSPIVPPVVPTVLPTPAPTPTPKPDVTPPPRAVRPVSPRPRPRPSVRAGSTPVAAAPIAAPSPTPLPTPTPASRSPTASASPAPVVLKPSTPWLAYTAAGVLALIGIGFILVRGRRPANDRFVEADDEAQDAPIDMPEPQPAFVQVTRPRPGLVYRPFRIGLNIITATIEGEITVTNVDEYQIEAVDVRIALLGAATGHADAVADIHRQPPTRLLAPQFALKPGESKTIRAIAAIGRSDIAPLSAGGRPIFVPMVAVTMAWACDGHDFRSTQAFAVGIERTDSPRLAPIRLDGPARIDGIAARVHDVSIG